MIGGDRAVAERLDPIFAALAPGDGTAGRAESRAARGYLYCGPHGAGHFVKMIHNGIEYGMMQAYEEGFDILHSADRESLPVERRYNFDLAAIAEVWRHGSVVSCSTPPPRWPRTRHCPTSPVWCRIPAKAVGR
jgi:6-phosphogluconate dehydrogenase